MKPFSQLVDLMDWTEKIHNRPDPADGFEHRFDSIVPGSYVAAIRILGNLPGATRRVRRAIYYWEDNSGEHIVTTIRFIKKDDSDGDDARR